MTACSRNAKDLDVVWAEPYLQAIAEARDEPAFAGKHKARESGECAVRLSCSVAP